MFYDCEFPKDSIWLMPCENSLEDVNKDWNRNDFIEIGHLGSGTFGNVIKVKRNDNPKQYAMKIISKYNI